MLVKLSSKMICGPGKIEIITIAVFLACLIITLTCCSLNRDIVKFFRVVSVRCEIVAINSLAMKF